MTDKVLLCAIAKQENLYIKEWVDYHLNLGFDHITIYDNNNTNGERISDVVSGDMRVDVVDFRGKTQKSCETQVEAYNHCYRNAKNYAWVLFIDIDEFLWFKDYANIKVFLSQNWVRRANVIRFHWKCYSDGEQLRYEDRPVMERFTQPCENAEVNFHTKQMYRTNLGSLRIVNVHYSTNVSYIFYPDGRPAPYTTSTKDSSIHDEVAHIKHYVTKSLEEYVRVKWARRCEGSSKTRLSMDFYFKYNKRTDEKVRYYNQLMNELKGNKGNVFVPKHTSGRNACPAELAVCPGAVKSSPKTSAITPKISPNSADVAKVDKEYPFGVSVCISAWKTAEYIEECLDSVAAQTWFKDNDNWEILLGIDGCEETLAKVKEIMHKYKNLKVMMMDKNVGTYVTCNTIMKEANYEWLLRFDSDDVMPNDMIAKIFSHDLNGYGAIRYNNQNFGSNNYRGLAWGSHLIRHNVFDVYGGYRDWRISGDYDLLYRIEPDVKVLKLNDIFYNRRVRENSLQFSKDTSMKSEKRKKLDGFVKNESRNQPKIKMNTISYSTISDYIDYICFIIPNRGGTHLNNVINNINNVYADYKKEIIVIQQCDDELFKKGQLYNIALKHTKAKWVALTDNDIVHFNKIDLFKEYEKNNKTPYLGFTHITQVEITNDGYVKKEKKENKVGAGAFLFGMRDDFIKVNGFSNLYSGWGCEDNEISCRLCGDNSTKPTLKHLEQELGHITHPKRLNQNIFEKNRNRFFSRKNRNIADDGINQTVYDLISTSTSENVTYINVRNIRVCNDFKYKNLL